MDLKRFIAKSRVFPLAGALFLFAVRSASGQIAVSDYATLSAAIASSSVITNFVTNSIITLSTLGQTFEITTNVFIDGGTNNIVIDGSSSTRLFHVHPKCQLILNNLQLLNGISSSGGAIFNEGSLIISNSIIAGNAATNITGVNGTTNSAGGNGSNGSSGGSATGGAIYSTGPVAIYYSVLGTNSASGGAGGTGGSGGGSPFFGGNGGDGGNGGSASGAAIFSSGSNNVFFADEFIDNQCIAGPGGGGGGAGSGSFDPGNTGQGGAGGSAVGGALYVAGNLYMSNCLFYLNSATAGASAGAEVTFDGGGSSGSAGGSATGGGLFVGAMAAKADVENTVFFNNSCAGGAGGNASGEDTSGGAGGSVLGGGFDCGAVQAIVRSCTLATNTLIPGTNGVGTSSSGSLGSALGWQICVSAGRLILSDSILSGGTNQAPDNTPNAYGVTDGGYNVNSDASIVRRTSTTLLNANTGLDSGLAAEGGPPLGPADVTGPAMLTLALLGGPGAQFIPGVAGITFPAVDELLQPRGSPASAGAFEFAPITLTTNSSPPTITSQPVGETNAVGTSATFTVSAEEVTTNATNYSFGYQWQLNGTNLSDSGTFSGATTSNLTVRTVNLTDQGPYQVIVGVSTLEGVTTSAVAYLVAIVPPKITVQPTSKLNQPDGAVVSFKVAATGAEPLTYQWRKDSQDLSDGGDISGSMTSNLVINPATPSDAGTYSVVIANAYGTITSASVPLTVVPDKTRPTVAITSPAPNARTTNFVISGKASDNAQVTGVFWWITNINAGEIMVTSNMADLDTNGTTARTWSISNAVSPGTNIVAVQSVDYSGNLSPIVSEKFFYVATSIFALATSGSGTVKGVASIAGNTPPANGAMLNIGEGYTLTAVPAANFVLTNWTSNGVPIFSPTLHFTMEPGLAIVANFTSNLFVGAAGTYNGLFYQASGVTEQTAGMLSQLTIKSTGAYSGKLLLNGASYSLAGSFDVSGNASNLVTRSAASGGPVKVEMTLQWTDGQITGTVTGADDAWTSTIFAEAAAAAPTSAEYTAILLPSTNAPAEIPPGDGYLLLTNHLGQVVYSGALADGAAINQSTPVGRLGDVPLFVNLYGNTGLMLGWLAFTNGTFQAEAPLAWIKPRSNSGLFAGGFTNLLSVIISGWTNLATQLSSGTLVISSATIDLTNIVSIANNTITEEPGSAATSLSGTINPKTGLLTLTFGNGSGKSTTAGFGALLQDSTNAGGYFVTRTNAGSIVLSPN